MAGSIFRRLLLTYLTIIVLVIAALAGLLTQYFNLLYFNNKQQLLLAAGKELRTAVYDYRRGKIGRPELTLTVNNLGRVTESRILILDGEGVTRLQLKEESAGQDPAGESLARDLKLVLQGKTVVRRRNYSSQFNTYMVFAGLPLFSGGKTTGALLLFSPVSEVNRTLQQVYQIIWGTAVTAIITGGIIIYLTSRRLSRPIIEITRSATAIARGEYGQDIPASGTDEIARLGQSFNYMKNRLQQVERMRRELIANVSHELRTPLTTIRGFLQALLEGVIPLEQGGKYLRLAFEETGRLARLVNDLLDLAKLQTGNLKLERSPLDLVEVLSECVEEFRLEAEQKGILLIEEHQADRLIILGDRDRMKQIVLNLLSNAIRYTGSGGRVKITASRDGWRATVRVADSGIGIPAGELDYIFEKFHRVDRSRDSVSGGTGLGLAIAKELVELHGGTISAASQPEQGTEMTMVYNLFTI